MSAAREATPGGDRPRSVLGSALLLLALGLLVAVWCAGFTTAYFGDADAYDYAQMGRELARGHGFSTLQVFPRHLVYFDELDLLDREDWPNLYRYPLPVVVQAGAQVALGSDPAHAGIVRSGLFYLLALAGAAWLLWRLEGPWVSLAALVFLASDVDLWIDSYSGMVESQAMACGVGLALVLCGALARWPSHLLLGLLSGALVLTKTQYTPVVALVPALLWLRLEPGRRSRALATLTLGMLLMLCPWMLRNASLTGNPLFSFSTTRNLVLGTQPVGSDIEMRIDAPSETGAVLAQYGGAIRSKLLAGLARAGRGELVAGSRLYSLLALVTAIAALLPRRWRAGPRARSCVLLALGLLLLGILSVSLSFPAARFVYPLRPLLLTAAVLAVCSALSGAHGRRSRRASVLVAVALALAALPPALTLARGRAPWRAPDAGSHEIVASMAEMVEKDALIASDRSDQVVLFADRRSLRLPHEPADLLALSDRLRPVEYVYLSGDVPRVAQARRPSRGMFARYSHYAAFVQTQDFRRRYAPVRAFRDGSRLYRLQRR